LDGHSFRILCIIHFSRFTDRRLFGRKGGQPGPISFSSMARSTFGPIIIALLLLLSHHHVRYYSLFRGREKNKRKKKLDLTCSLFFFFSPASLLILSSSNRDEMTQVYLIFNFRSVGKLKFFSPLLALLYFSAMYIYKPLFFAPLLFLGFYSEQQQQ
jgi:hypothetical protein